MREYYIDRKLCQTHHSPLSEKWKLLSVNIKYAAVTMNSSCLRRMIVSVVQFAVKTGLF